MSKSITHITEEAAEWSNISDSLDYELRGKRKKTWAGRWIMAHRDLVIRATQSSILCGTLRPGSYTEKTINERGKIRTIQCISLLRSIGIHAVMKIVEKYLDRAFIVDTAGGVLFGKLYNVFAKEKINPMIGAAGISAFPMSARVVHKMGLAEDNQNFLLMHSIGVNVSGQVASVIAGGLILTLVGALVK